MLNDPNEIRRSLVAERRGLLLTSFVLFFYEQAGLRIDKISVFGNEVSLSDPWWVSVAIWVLWLYFGLRYLQYFMATQDTGFSDAYKEWMRRIITQSAFRRFKKSFLPDEEHTGYIPSFKLRDEKFPLVDFGIWSVELDISIAYQKNGVTATGKTYKEEVKAAGLLWARVRAAFCVLFLTHVATEYYLPFLVALLPLVSPLSSLIQILRAS